MATRVSNSPQATQQQRGFRTSINSQLRPVARSLRRADIKRIRFTYVFNRGTRVPMFAKLSNSTCRGGSIENHQWSSFTAARMDSQRAPQCSSHEALSTFTERSRPLARQPGDQEMAHVGVLQLSPEPAQASSNASVPRHVMMVEKEPNSGLFYRACQRASQADRLLFCIPKHTGACFPDQLCVPGDRFQEEDR
jgi:hypothetical protein